MRIPPAAMALGLFAAMLLPGSGAAASESDLQSDDIPTDEAMTLADSTLQPLIWTSRMNEALEFYRDTLGLPFLGRSHGAAMFAVGNTILRVSPVPSTVPSTHTVIGFAVEDVRATAAALRARGISFERFPVFAPDEHGVVETPEGALVVWFRDPDGNLISIVQFE